jgi:hypothetical protein
MLESIFEISVSSWFCYEEICYDARSHERKKTPFHVCEMWVFKSSNPTIDIWMWLMERGEDDIKNNILLFVFAFEIQSSWSI